MHQRIARWLGSTTGDGRRSGLIVRGHTGGSRWGAALGVVAAVLFVAFGAATGAIASALAQPGGGGTDVRATLTAQRTSAHPGDQFALALRVDMGPSLHIWPNKPVLPPELDGVIATPTEIRVAPSAKLPPGVRVATEFAQWPTPQSVRVGFGSSPVEILSHKDGTTIFMPLVLAPDLALGEVRVPIELSFQACDDTQCFRPETIVAEAKFTVVARDQAIVEGSPAVFRAFDASVFAKVLAGAVPTPDAPSGARARFDFFGYEFFVGSGAVVVIYLLAFVAGLIMNFTPCVLPVLPLKILSLQHHAKSPGKLVYYGVIYCFGIVLTYLVLGLLAFGLITGGQRFDWGQIFTLPWFTIGMALLVGVMGLGMMGLFTIQVPDAISNLSPTGDSATGNLLMGVLTAILAVPCTGPLLGGALAWAFTQPPVVGLGAFVAMGVGMASPYAVLIAFPSLMNRLPRGGAGGELLKQVLGLFMIAVAVYLVGNVTSAKWPWFAVGAVAAVALLWLLVGAWRMLRSTSAKVVCTIIAVGGLPLTAWATFALTREGPIVWTVLQNRPDDETRAKIADAVAKRRVVVVDFTAKWCVNCHVIERTVLNSPEGVAVLNARDVDRIKIDLTNAGADQGWGLVREVSGGGGIPLIAVFGPGVEGKPVFFQSFFKPSDLAEAVRRARGQ